MDSINAVRVKELCLHEKKPVKWFVVHEKRHKIVHSIY